MKCAECEKNGLRSTVHWVSTFVHAMPISRFYDEDGREHIHNPNDEHINMKCSNGHKFSISKAAACPTCEKKPKRGCGFCFPHLYNFEEDCCKNGCAWSRENTLIVVR